mgnify:FL=1
MKRTFLSLLTIFCLALFTGCPGGEEETGAGEGTTPAADGTSADGTAQPAGGEFKEGVGSGRSEDGSDEER